MGDRCHRGPFSTSAILRQALEQARRDELLARNVAALVEPPGVRRHEVTPLSS